MKKVIVTSSICLIIDQIIKLIIVNTLTLHKSVELINNFFALTYVKNTGAAFSIFSGNRFLLIAVTMLALALIYYFLVKESLNAKNSLLYGILYGGIIGNLIDRIFRGYVIDYLDFNLFGYDFPIFNFADICIVISILMIIILSFVEGLHGKRSN